MSAMANALARRASVRASGWMLFRVDKDTRWYIGNVMERDIP